MAARCTIALVEPLVAWRTTDALLSAARLMIWRGVGPPATAISAARLPVASAMRMRSDETAGAVAAPGSGKPRGSAGPAIVDAVPITMQGPEGGISWSWARSRSAGGGLPGREAAPNPAGPASGP